ncbi:MAG TPA: ABC-2 family transporter protein, partial [Acidimicrobiales bacterium]|nr:ABC-2 family transporter protein [Acidimicrobiales bacterium]
RVRTGEIVGDLYRPVDFHGYWFTTDVGRFGFQLLFRGIPPVLLGSVVFDLALPNDASTWVAFLLSVCLALAVSFGVRYLASLSAFWLLDTRGVWQMTAVVSMFLAGIMVPLGFLPDGVREVVLWLPFAAISQLSIDILLGHADVAPMLARQAIWAVALALLGRAVTRRAFRKVVVQGG